MQGQPTCTPVRHRYSYFGERTGADSALLRGHYTSRSRQHILSGQCEIANQFCLSSLESREPRSQPRSAEQKRQPTAL